MISGGEFLRSRSINFDGNPFRFPIVFVLHLVRFSKEHVIMMLLQERDKVNKRLNLDESRDSYALYDESKEPNREY